MSVQSMTEVINTLKDYTLPHRDNAHAMLLGLRKVDGEQKLVLIDRKTISCWQRFLAFFGFGTTVSLAKIGEYLRRFDWKRYDEANRNDDGHLAWNRVFDIASKLLGQGNSSLLASISRQSCTLPGTQKQIWINHATTMKHAEETLHAKLFQRTAEDSNLSAHVDERAPLHSVDDFNAVTQMEFSPYLRYHFDHQSGYWKYERPIHTYYPPPVPVFIPIF